MSGSHLFCSPAYIQNLVQFLAHNMHFINICWMNESWWWEPSKKKIPRIQAQMTERIQRIVSAEVTSLNFGLYEFEKAVVHSGVHISQKSMCGIGAQKSGEAGVCGTEIH